MGLRALILCGLGRDFVVGCWFSRQPSICGPFLGAWLTASK
jgi:hypothetical protein